MKDYLFKEVSNTALIIFRVFFGLLMWIESWGAIATGWVKKTFVDPDFTFTFMGFEWTQPLLGDFMYLYYFIMGIFGVGIMLGYKYRLSAVGFFLMWSLTYFMQKTNYNNHYYLIMLISGLMVLVPANRYFSLDTKINPSLKSHTTPNWVIQAFKIQVALVYFFAAIAKLYPGWYENKFLSLRLARSAHWFQERLGDNFISDTVRYEPFQYTLTYTGIIFDFVVAPLLFFKKTRWIAFIALVIFHLMNSALLHIGIFPFFALALSIFFFSTEGVNKIFKLKNKEALEIEKQELSKPWKSTQNQNIILTGFLIAVAIQVLLPLRHWAIPENVLWTEEGHRLSWRMMLRTKATRGPAQFKVVIPETGKNEYVSPLKYLNTDQTYTMSSKPDMIWQFAQFLEKEYQKQGIKDIEVYVNTKVSVNGSPYYELIDNKVDLTSVPWKTFGHQDWILEEPDLNAERKSTTFRKK